MSDSGVIFTAAAPAFHAALELSAACPGQGERTNALPSRREAQAILDIVLRMVMVVSRRAGERGRRISVPFQDRLTAGDLEQ
jgi:hypothetical protein